MATRIPLPRRDSLPDQVVFHRQSGEQRLVLQVPTEDLSGSATYVVDLERGDDRTWLACLQESEELMRRLDLAQHVVYAPRTGFCREVADLDEWTPTELMLAMGRASAGPAAMDRAFAARSRRAVPPVSPIRQLLGGPAWRR